MKNVLATVLVLFGLGLCSAGFADTAVQNSPIQFCHDGICS